MKLVTTIAPRGDGTVIVHGNDGNDYTFESNGEGELVCDVECNDTIENLISTGNFFPFDSADYDAALQHLGKDTQGTDDDAQDGAPDGVDDLDEEDEVTNGGMPLEAETPAASIPKTSRKTRKA